MMSQTLSHFKQVEMTCLGLLLFMSVFIGSLLWVYRKGSRDFYKTLERMPLDKP